MRYRREAVPIHSIQPLCSVSAVKSSYFSWSTKIYLLFRGVVKVTLVLALLKRKLRACPLALSVFAGLVGYQRYRFTITHGLGLNALTGVDMAYRALRRQRV